MVIKFKHHGHKQAKEVSSNGFWPSHILSVILNSIAKMARATQKTHDGAAQARLSRMFQAPRCLDRLGETNAKKDPTRRTKGALSTCRTKGALLARAAGASLRSTLLTALGRAFRL